VGLNQSSATRLVSRLEAKGLTRRDVCADDGRGVYAVITEQGEALVRAARGPFEERIGELLGEPDAHLAPQDGRQLGRAFQDIAAILSP
jgi:DNA-binding MarR family transcriptional regulator